MSKMPINWFDVLVLLVLLVGVQRGRKRGMSQEMITTLKWAAVVLVSAIAYEPLGQWLTDVTPFSRLFSYVLAYLVVAGVVASLFVLVNRSLGGKLVGSDTFGKGEYYLAMPSGMLRFACVLLAGLALLNARLYRAEEVHAMNKFQMDNYGSHFFPTLYTLQDAVFEDSLTGPQIKKHLGFLLIKPTLPEAKQLRRAGEVKLP